MVWAELSPAAVLGIDDDQARSWSANRSIVRIALTSCRCSRPSLQSVPRIASFSIRG
jgi:hypothetical protein